MKSTALSVIASLDLVLPDGVFHSPTPLPHLLILLFLILSSPSPSPTLYFSFHSESIPPFLCHFFIFSLHLLPQHHLHAVVSLSHSLPPRPIYAFLISQFVSLPQPVIIISLLPHIPLVFSFPLSHPPRLSIALLHRFRLCACVCRKREASQALVPAEQLPCKAIQIEMFAENNMCVITA